MINNKAYKIDEIIQKLKKIIEYFNDKKLMLEGDVLIQLL